MKTTSTAKDVLKIYWQALRDRKIMIFFMIAALTTGNVFELLAPVYYRRFFDTLTLGPNAPGIRDQLVWFLFIILFFHLCSWICWRYASFMNNFLQAKVMADLKQISFDYLIGHSYGFFSSNFGGSLVQKVNRLYRSFERFSDRMYWSLVPLVVHVIGIVVVLWLFNRSVAVIMIVWIFLFVAVNFCFSKWKLPYDIKRADLDSKTTATLADAITNHTNIQLFNGFLFESKLFQGINGAWRSLTKFNWDLGSIFEAIQSLLIFGAEFFLFYYSIRYWQSGVITIGFFVLIQTYLLFLVNHLWDSGRIVRDVYESMADAKEMVDILNKPHEVQDIPAAKTLAVTKGNIEFKNIAFGFHQTRQVLDDFNLVVRPGEKVALIGPSGAGKSTIVKLLFRLYDVTAGKILIDGQDIHTVTQESLHNALSLVPQDPILFHRTLAQNIRYGRRDATDSELYLASQQANCHEFIINLPYGYETYVGERGIKLSGGERQRVAIARAMLKNAPILVLDEATSSLDSHSEMLIQNALEKLMENKTVIVIAHRLSTIRKMDRIVVVDEGRVIEEGSHGELLAKPTSLYHKLWTLQAGGFLAELEEEPEEDPAEEI